MNGVPLAFDHGTDRAVFRRPAHRAGIELYQAHIVRHAFEPHTHEAYGLGAIESGVERFRYRGSEHLAPPDTLVLMNPDELHTGRAETEQGWRYRMVYLDADVLSALSGDAGWWFAEAVGHDAVRARRVGRLLQALWSCNDSLAFDSQLSSLVDELRPAARIGRTARAEAVQRFGSVIDFMHARLGDTLTLEMLAGVAGLSPYHFLRTFERITGVTPHQYVLRARLRRAATRLVTGPGKILDLALESGFGDLSNFNRAFRAEFGMSPRAYRRQAG